MGPPELVSEPASTGLSRIIAPPSEDLAPIHSNNLCRLSGGPEISGLGDDFRKAIGEAVELDASWADRGCTTMHFEDVLSSNKGLNDAFDARADTGQGCCRLGYKMA